MVLLITTAVAANDLLVRLECVLPEDLPPEIADLVEAIGQSLVFANSGDPAQVNQDIQELRANPLRRSANPSLRSVVRTHCRKMAELPLNWRQRSRKR
jgi:hypothetical protein